MTSATLTITLESGMLAALEEAAQAHNLTVENFIREALRAHLLPAMQLDLAALGEAMLTAIQVMRDDPEIEPLHITDEMVEATQAFLLPDDATRLVLGDELISQLIGLPAGAPLTAEASARLAAVTTVCRLLRGTLNEAGVRRWWRKRRYQLRGAAPLDLIGGGGWTPQTLAFREIAALAEADAGFAAT
ncbi:hypothetical protein GCM10008955_30380 [Deinococcus malanensis]|uniref:Ribbon-helix-helix protein CopG domain-containing protein n=1 Tax=Deinococcus malanensis TaxID=1706855 RepID=A0ABQ2EZH5_9DEIO|nr:ribbon-helix-helix protein, CopG family [Deinococcus malanensis]GGK34267.1 hypothetical protein GCM10008955_30380 [Deinococcus malanensis]